MGREDSPQLCQAIIDKIPLDQLLSFKRILDVGCGYGGISKAYVKRVENFIGREEAISRIWLIDNHIACVNRCLRLGLKNVIHDNFLSWTPNMKFDVVIGNPPYGNGGSLSVQFINKCFELSDDVRLVLPSSIKKPSLKNRINLQFDIDHSEDLPEDTFPGGINTVLQHWSLKSSKRQKVKTMTSHDDLVFTTKDKANVCIGRVGAGPSGKVFTQDFEHRSPSSHYFLKIDNANVIDKLVLLQDLFITGARENFNCVPSISKHKLISIYSEAK